MYSYDEQKGYSDEQWDEIGTRCGHSGSDDINHPLHYNTGNIETYDYIVDQLTADEYLGYTKGNILKYVSRERHKGGINDLRKAQWYLNKYIERIDHVIKDVDVHIAETFGSQSTKPLGNYGTTAPEQNMQEMINEKLSREIMTGQKDNEKRWVDVLERQLHVMEKVYGTGDTSSQPKEQCCTSASPKCHQPAGECQ